jgi:hypothetical protein
MANIPAGIAVDGRVALEASAIVAYLRERAENFAEACNGAPIDEHATAYRAVTLELRRIADELDVGCIGVLSDRASAD